MASVRPSPPRSQSYHRPAPAEKDSLRPLKQEKRSRSTSRNPSFRPYNADAPRRYAPNESRTRKPPFSPTVEDLGFGPEEVQMKGKPDQTPMLIQVGDDSSSTEESEPGTPESSVNDEQDSYIGDRVNKAGAPPQAEHVTVSKSKPTFEPQRPQVQSRRSRQTLTVDTERARSRSTGDGPRPNLQRERSPYSYPPSHSSKRDDRQESSKRGPEYMQSPSTMAPTVSPVRRDFEPQSVHARSKAGPPPGAVKNGGSANARPSLPRPQRPALERRASAMPQLGSPTSVKAARSLYVENSSDESDRGYARTRARIGQLTSDALPVNPPSYFETPRQTERHANMRNNRDSPPQTPLSPEHTRGALFNRETLLNGPGLQHLSTLLEGQQSNLRSASPRPSPQPSPRASPTASPGPSPPRTPPEQHQRHHRRTSTAESLSKYTNASKVSSPLSSRPSTPTSSAKTFTPRPMDYDAPPPLTKERRTSTWDSADLAKQATAGAKAESRPSSPTVSRHESREKYDPKYQRSAQPTYSPGGSSGRAALEPARPERRPSREELRKNLPNLSTKPVVHQDSSDPKSQAPRNRSGSYIPASATAAVGASFLDPNSSTSRSRSIAPDAHRHRHRSRSRSYNDAREAPRARSTAPARAMPASDQRQPVLLPQCSRPEPVVGYDDWYVLEREPSMTICPDCRHGIFGIGYERSFRPTRETKRSQKVHCSMNDPWVRLACLDIFKRRQDTKTLGYIMEYTKKDLPCPESRLADNRVWYHLRDSETGRDFQDFQVCSHCVNSLDAIYPEVDIFHRSRNIKQDHRVCNLRSDVTRFGKYLNYIVGMAEEEERTGTLPATSDFIWEIKWQTIISPCNGASVHYGQDMHTHPEIPGFTVCEECYYKSVRPLLKSSIVCKDSKHFLKALTPEAKEIVGGTSCKLYSPRMKQIFEKSVRERDLEGLQKAVKKRVELQMDLEEHKMEHAKKPHDKDIEDEVKYLQGKWAKLERKHGEDRQ